MNVFESLKGALNTATSELTSGLKNLNLQSKTHVPLKKTTFNYDAGAEILSKFQQHWIDIHQATEDNSKATKEVDKRAKEILHYCQNQNEAVEHLNMLVADLPELNDTLGKLMQQIDDVSDLLQSVSHELIELEDVSEALEQQHNKQHHYTQLQNYEQKQKAELQITKVKLAKAHATKVSSYERHLQSQIRDRQEAFEPAYKQEMQHYKQYGSTTVKPISVVSTDIADIQIDDDNNTEELQRFLDDDEDKEEADHSGVATGDVDITSGDAAMRDDLHEPAYSEDTCDSAPDTVNVTATVT